MENKLNIYIGTLKSDNTKKAYRKNIEDFLQCIDNNITFENYLKWRGSISEYASATQFQKIEAVRGFVGFLCDLKVVDSDTYVRIKSQKAPKVNNKPKYALTSEQVQEMMKMAKNPRDKVIMSILFSTGLRVSELISISVDDIKNDTIRILGKGDKFRYTYVNDQVREDIFNYMLVRKDSDYNNFLINNQGKPMSQKTVNKTLKLLASRAGVDVKTLNFSTHSTRHTCLTALSNNGTPIEIIQQVAGHSDIRTTKRYVEVNEERVKSAIMNFSY